MAKFIINLTARSANVETLAQPTAFLPDPKHATLSAWLHEEKPSENDE